MFSIGDFVKVKSTNIYGVVIGYTNVFNVCQQTEEMLIVSITNSDKTELFRNDSVEKVGIE